MKQLKFMLAAATAIGLATVAQADTQIVTQPVDSEDFEGYTTETPFADLTGFSYDGTENDSAIIAGGATAESSFALQVSTSTDPILRKLDTENDLAINLADDEIKNLSIDTMVKFTVTPAGDTVSVTSDDKLMIYLAEFTNEVEGTVIHTTNLVVRAAGLAYDSEGALTGDFVENGREYVIEGVEIDPNEWYRLQVKARAVLMDNENSGYWPVFQVFVGEYQLYPMESGFDDETSGLVYDNEKVNFSEDFVSLQVTDIGNFFANDSDGIKLASVGFAGEGKVDDIVITKDVIIETVLDFTFVVEWDKGISAVTYAIGGVNKGEVPVAGVKVPKGETVEFTPVLKDTEWTQLAANQQTTYENVQEGKEISFTTVTITSKPSTDGGVVLNPNATVAEIQASAEIKDGYFAGKDVTKEELTTVLNWKAKKGADYNIDNISFGVAPDEESDATKAYLLNCSKEELADEVANFKFPAIVPGVKPSVNAPLHGGDYNGTLNIYGADTVGGLANEVEATADHKFFKAVLTK